MFAHKSWAPSRFTDPIFIFRIKYSERCLQIQSVDIFCTGDARASCGRQGTLPRFGGTPLIVYDTLLVLDCLLLYLRLLHLPHATSVGRHCRNRLLQVRHSLFLHDSGDILARQKEAVSLAESFR